MIGNRYTRKVRRPNRKRCRCGKPALFSTKENPRLRFDKDHDLCRACWEVELAKAKGRAAMHTCHARGCRTRVPPKLLMCARHWRQVPRPLQRAVWSTYRPGQEIDKRPTVEYLAAADAAIEAVFAKEQERAASSPQGDLFGGRP